MHTVRLIPQEVSISAAEDLPVLAAAQRAGLALPHSCRSGRCGSCRARLLSGRIEYQGGLPLGLSAQERRDGYVLLCQALARSDLVVEARPVQSAAGAEIKTLPSRIARRVQLAPDVMQLILRVPAVESMEFLAGQYLDVLLEGGLRRSYSVANAPHSGSQFELHVRHVPGGAFSDPVFSTLREGALLKIEGPLGRFIYQGGPGPTLFIAGGTGFAPIKAMLGEALKEESAAKLHLYWGARDAVGIYEEALVRDWAARHARLNVHTVLSVASTPPHRRGWVHEAVLQDHPDLAAFAIYAAGPPAMIDAIRASFPTRGARPEQLYLDSFDYAAPT
ncbi:MAG TPA: 2Fe-2S iron-sulfur cluster-binding protein [Steroidobacteraceae bacterium]|nr:2Fe-2S iron-sulfur cluster-binding protein [Steroidobacteraceae bacterium]